MNGWSKSLCQILKNKKSETTSEILNSLLGIVHIICYCEDRWGRMLVKNRQPRTFRTKANLWGLSVNGKDREVVTRTVTHDLLLSLLGCIQRTQIAEGTRNLAKKWTWVAERGIRNPGLNAAGKGAALSILSAQQSACPTQIHGTLPFQLWSPWRHFSACLR